jgi:phage-related protein
MRDDKPLVWLDGKIKTPPFTREGRIDAGTLLRRLQRGEKLRLPQSRPMPSIGTRCHELKVDDAGHWWRVIYRTDSDAIVIGGVFPKKTNTTPDQVIRACKARFKAYDAAKGG